jgi:hypothetical protein
MIASRNRVFRRAAAREARKLMRGGMAVGLVAFGACGESHSRVLDTAADSGSLASAIDAGATDRDTVAHTIPNPGAADAGNTEELSETAVTRGHVARDVFYSWTTKAQIDELRANPVLLTRSENSDGKRPHSSTVIESLASAGDAIAQVLAGEKFQRGRYAWSSAWATLRGWPDESYGDQLLRIVLKPEAWIAVVERGTTRVVGRYGGEIALDEVLANPERIAAVYLMHEGSADPNACGTFQGCGTGAYREYFINNESMILEWSFATQATLGEIERGIDVIAAVRDKLASTRLGDDACIFSYAAYCAWQSPRLSDVETATFDAYLQGLALTSEFYVPTRVNMDALIAALQASVFTPDPFEHRP